MPRSMQPQVIQQQPSGSGILPALGLLANVLLQNWPAVAAQGAGMLTGSQGIGQAAGMATGMATGAGGGLPSSGKEGSKASTSGGGATNQIEKPKVEEVGAQTPPAQEGAPPAAPPVSAPTPFGGGGDPRVQALMMENPFIVSLLSELFGFAATQPDALRPGTPPYAWLQNYAQSRPDRQAPAPPQQTQSINPAPTTSSYQPMQFTTQQLDALVSQAVRQQEQGQAPGWVPGGSAPMLPQGAPAPAGPPMSFNPYFNNSWG
jgi:hypothetical protein